MFQNPGDAKSKCCALAHSLAGMVKGRVTLELERKYGHEINTFALVGCTFQEFAFTIGVGLARYDFGMTDNPYFDVTGSKEKEIRERANQLIIEIIEDYSLVEEGKKKPNENKNDTWVKPVKRTEWYF